MCIYIQNLTFSGSFCILIGVKITPVGMEFDWSKKAKVNCLHLVQVNKLRWSAVCPKCPQVPHLQIQAVVDLCSV